MSDVKPVLIAAGGTGGHVYPALAVAEVLRVRDVPVIWLGTRNGLESRVVPQAGFDIEWVDVSGLRGKNAVATLLAPIKLIRSCFQAWRVFSRCNPGAVLGMGGFVAGPGSLVALLRRRPLCVHEQNSVAGMTNQYVARFAKRVFTAYPGVLAKQSSPEEIGNPVRPDISSVGQSKIENGTARRAADAPVRILVVGGSLGARILNQTMPHVAARLAAKMVANITEKCEIWHQTGPKEFQQTADAYTDKGADQRAGTQADMTSDAKVEPYIENMADAYAWADLVICRSGAMTVSELAAAGVASVLIPYPFAVDDHQTTNAQWLVDAGAAKLLPQDQMTTDTLSQMLVELIEDPTRLQSMADNARGLYRQGAAERVADALQEMSL